MKKKIIIIVSIVVVVFLVAGGVFAYLNLKPPSPEEMARYEEIIEAGDLLFEAREFSEAVSKYNEAIKVVDTDGRAYSRIVDIYLLKNDLDTSQKVADRAQNMISTSELSLIYAKIAKEYFDQKDYNNAKINYEIAESISDNPTVNLGLAKAYVFDNEFSSAEDLLRKEYDNDTVDEATLLYSYILGTEDTQSALDIIKDYTPTNSEKSSYFEEYLSVLESLTDDDLYNIAKLSRVYINGGYPTLAIKILEPKSNDIEQYVDALYFLGKAYLDIKEYDSALETLLKSANLLGYESNKYWMLARTYYYLDDLVNATDYYDMAINYSGDDLSQELVEEYLSILLDSNQISKAQEVYTDIVKTIDESWLYLTGLELYYESGVDAKFDFYLDKLANEDLDEEEKSDYLFWKIRKDIDDSENASIENDLENLRNIDRLNPKYYWVKGLYQLSLSENTAARDSFELALEYDLKGEVTQEVEKLLAQI